MFEGVLTKYAVSRQVSINELTTSETDRERQRDRETERQTDRERQRETERQRDRHPTGMDYRECMVQTAVRFLCPSFRHFQQHKLLRRELILFDGLFHPGTQPCFVEGLDESLLGSVVLQCSLFGFVV